MTLDKYSIAVDRKCVLGEPDCKIYCAKFDWDDKYIAAGNFSFFFLPPKKFFK